VATRNGLFLERGATLGLIYPTQTIVSSLEGSCEAMATTPQQYNRTTEPKITQNKLGLRFWLEEILQTAKTSPTPQQPILSFHNQTPSFILALGIQSCLLIDPLGTVVSPLNLSSIRMDLLFSGITKHDEPVVCSQSTSDAIYSETSCSSSAVGELQLVISHWLSRWTGNM
jgi:hypothetical protein